MRNDGAEEKDVVHGKETTSRIAGIFIMALVTLYIRRFTGCSDNFEYTYT